jgi:hypothetical protein
MEHQQLLLNTDVNLLIENIETIKTQKLDYIVVSGEN